MVFGKQLTRETNSKDIAKERLLRLLTYERRDTAQTQLVQFAHKAKQDIRN